MNLCGAAAGVGRGGRSDNCLYVERDELCLSEYLAYEQRPNGSYGALPGHHDDLLMTRAIGLHICFREMPPPRLITRSDSGPNRPRPASAAVI